MGKTGLMMRLLDAGGRVRAGLSVESDGVAIAFVDRSGRLQTGVNAIRVGAGSVFPDETTPPAGPRP
jgi:hypothetical protein